MKKFAEDSGGNMFIKGRKVVYMVYAIKDGVCCRIFCPLSLWLMNFDLRKRSEADLLVGGVYDN